MAREPPLSVEWKTWGTRTNLSLFVDGKLLSWTNETPAYDVRDSGTPGAPADSDLYLGYDPATGTRFTGVVDEFRLYKTALSSDGTRGLVWFLKGANNVLIPRGVFYGSKMYGALNGSWSSFNTTDQPLKGATVNGNDDSLSSYLNGRVVQMVITKNVTSHKRGGSSTSREPRTPRGT